MANLQKVVKVTKAQYNTLASGGTVGGYTGLNNDYIYLIVDDYNYNVNNIYAWDSANNEWRESAYSRSDDDNGTSIVLPGHLTIFGDNDNDNPEKPTDEISGGQGDVDLTIFNTGVFITDGNGNDFYISFPAKSGIFALTSDIPTVNNGTLSIQGNGITASTFTANQSGNTTLNIKGSGGTTVTKTADNEITIYSPSVSYPVTDVKVNGSSVMSGTIAQITVPTKVSDLTNDSGFITGITSSDVTTALGYTPVNPSNISAVGFSGDYDDLLNKPSIPTNTSDLNNDSGFITGDDVPSNQSTSVVVKNAITNINGRVFQNYTATLITAGGYTFYQIYKNGNNPTEAEAAEYMRYMTGSTFVPKYNYDFPKQTVFTFEDRSTWKPQFSSIDGLRLYRLTTPLALESQIPTSYIATVSVSGNLLTITDSNGNTTTFASDAPQILDLRV